MYQRRGSGIRKEAGLRVVGRVLKGRALVPDEDSHRYTSLLAWHRSPLDLFPVPNSDVNTVKSDTVLAL